MAAGGDYLVPSYANFAQEWERLRAAPTATETFALSAMDSIQGPFISLALCEIVTDIAGTAACDSIVEILGLAALGGSQTAGSGPVHTMQLAGLLIGGGGKVLVRCRMTHSRGEDVTLELVVRAEQQPACDLVLAAIGG